MTPNLTPEQRQAFADALYEGKKIEAIKQLRELSGLGLKESKDIIDNLEAELRTAYPERFTSSKKRSGCVLLFILLFPFGVLLWFFFRR
ncbi:MAG TPA: ribosomal protein L7/L12 [Candidatus Limnocylindria bacterium]|nr:ribosomal protein L7/L12 [Candidatus Limnocylindria bacterium]